MDRKNKRSFYFQAFCVGLLISTFYWFFETGIHFFIFHSDTFISALLSDDSNELWMRIFTVMLFFFSTTVFAYFIREKVTLIGQLRLSSQALHIMQEGCVITNHLNEIIYVNPRYEVISGYKLSELKGKNPSVLSSGKQDKSFYQNLWLTLSKEEFWEGELWNRNKSGELYIEWIHVSVIKNKNGEIEHYVGVLSDITSQKKTEEKIKYYAYYDPLTNLPNRRLFIDRLQHAMEIAKRRKEKIAILFLDLDHFKLINDQFGHLAGDQFLCETAKRIQEAVRKSDTVSRFGGDEFVMLLLNVQSKEQAVLLAKNILSHLNASSVEINSHYFEIKASIGGALYPDDSEDAEKIIQCSDRAMYQAKKQTGNNVAFHE